MVSADSTNMRATSQRLCSALKIWILYTSNIGPLILVSLRSGTKFNLRTVNSTNYASKLLGYESSSRNNRAYPGYGISGISSNSINPACTNGSEAIASCASSK